MTSEELLKKEYWERFTILQEEFSKKVSNMQSSLLEKYCEYKVGDFVKNVTGIIKIERIEITFWRDQPKIEYFGYRYWWDGNKNLKRTNC